MTDNDLTTADLPNPDEFRDVPEPEWTEETFPLTIYTIESAIEILGNELEAYVADQPVTAIGCYGLEEMADLSALREGLMHMINPPDGAARCTPGQALTSHIILALESTPQIPDFYTVGVGDVETALREWLWSDFEGRCPRCFEYPDYCQGHGVLG